MRLKRNRLKLYKLHEAVAKVSDEGIKKAVYSDESRDIYAEIWPASGKLQAELYGQRLSYILNCLVDRETDIKEKDGICINSDHVTHKVISVKVYSNHKLLELEQCRS